MNLRRPEFGAAVAEVSFLLRANDGTQHSVVARVGKPYRVSDAEWACPVELLGLEPRHPDIRGTDALQALCLATALIRLRLVSWLERGGTVKYASGAEVDRDHLDAMFGQTDHLAQVEQRRQALRRAVGAGRPHPLLPDSTQYQIVGMRLDLRPGDGSEPHLDLTLERDNDRRAMRFWSPQELQVEQGGPCKTGGLVLLDISSHGLEGLGVAVDDIEASAGAVRFVARAVEPLVDNGA